MFQFATNTVTLSVGHHTDQLTSNGEKHSKPAGLRLSDRPIVRPTASPLSNPPIEPACSRDCVMDGEAEASKVITSPCSSQQKQEHAAQGLTFPSGRASLWEPQEKGT